MMRALAAAFAFLTRLPVGRGFVADRELGREMGRSVGFFPVVGLILGLVAMGMGRVLAGHLPSAVVAVAIVAFLAAITGGLHLDGVADLFDGLAGGAGDRARTLEIMRDSRIGAAGAVALMLVLAAKAAAVGALIDGRDFGALLAFPLVARWAVTPQLVLFPYARPDGLGRAFTGAAGPRELVVATAIVVLVGIASGPSVAVPALAALLASFTIAVWLRRRLGGLTGDVYGATIEIAEVVALCAATVARGA